MGGTAYHAARQRSGGATGAITLVSKQILSAWEAQPTTPLGHEEVSPQVPSHSYFQATPQTHQVASIALSPPAKVGADCRDPLEEVQAVGALRSPGEAKSGAEDDEEWSEGEGEKAGQTAHHFMHRDGLAAASLLQLASRDTSCS